MLTFIEKDYKDQPFKIAFSGGVDSLVLAHFHRRNPNAILCHFNHGCQYSNDIEEQCWERAESLKMKMVVGHITAEKKAKQSLEDFWRRQRYRWLYSVKDANTVITAHHLNDAIESWCMSAFHGKPQLIQPIQYNAEYEQHLVRPLLLTSKADIIRYAETHNLSPVDDPYNREDHLMRNYFRKHTLEHVLYHNPGIDKVIRKKYLNAEY